MSRKSKIHKRKTPVIIILIIIWMFLAVLRGISKLFDMERLEAIESLFGKTLAFINYRLDILIIVAFIIFIILFIKRTPKTWKYFIYFIGFLIIGVIIGSSYILLFPESFLNMMVPSGISSNFILIFSFIGVIIVILFYVLIGYLVYKNREYFKK